MSLRPCLFASFAALIFTAPVARADEPDAAPPRASSGAARFRFGVEFVSGAFGLAHETFPTMLGVGVRAGVQLNGSVAIVAQGSLTLLWPAARGGAELELTPVDWLTFAIGPSYERATAPDGAGGRDGASTAALPLRLSFNLPLARSRNGARSALSISGEAIPGVVFDTTTPDQPKGFAMGALGGIGYQYY